MEIIDGSKDLVEVNFKCEKCGQGNMIYHHKNNVVDGILKYLNKCNYCGYEELMLTFYPTVKERSFVGDLTKPGFLITLCAKECEK